MQLALSDIFCEDNIYFCLNKSCSFNALTRCRQMLEFFFQNGNPHYPIILTVLFWTTTNVQACYCTDYNFALQLSIKQLFGIIWHSCHFNYNLYKFDNYNESSLLLLIFDFYRLHWRFGLVDMLKFCIFFVFS